jgi:hypothetical protein
LTPGKPRAGGWWGLGEDVRQHPNLGRLCVHVKVRAQRLEDGGGDAHPGGLGSRAEGDALLMLFILAEPPRPRRHIIESLLLLTALQAGETISPVFIEPTRRPPELERRLLAVAPPREKPRRGGAPLPPWLKRQRKR